MNNKKIMPFTEHLAELRSRVIKSLLALFISFVLCFSLSDFIYRIITYPLDKGVNFSAFTFTEGIMVQLKIGVYAGVFVSLPYILAQVFLFVSPGLKPEERKATLIGLVIGSMLFLAGVMIFYLVILPPLIPGLRSFLFKDVNEVYNLKENVDFILKMLVRFGIAFQLPIVVFVFVKSRIIKLDTLSRNRRYVIIILLILAAFLTPQDVLSQMAMALPLYILFELTIIVCKLWGG